MENKKQELIKEAKRLHGKNILPCNPMFTIEPKLNLLIFWYSWKLDNGKFTTGCLTTNVKEKNNE